MKPINLKDLVKAWAFVEHTEDKVKSSKLDGWLPGIESDKKTLEYAKKAFSDASVAVTSALDAVQARCTARTITAKDIVQAIKEIEERLDMVSTKKDAVGTIAHVDYNAQHFPNAYRYIPESTQVTLVLKSSGWTLTHIIRNACKSPANRIVLTLTEATKAHMAERVSRIGG